MEEETITISIIAELSNFIEKSLRKELEEAGVKKITPKDIQYVFDYIKKIARNYCKYTEILIITTNELPCIIIRSIPKRMSDVITRRDELNKEANDIMKKLLELEKKGFKLLPYYKAISVPTKGIIVRLTLRCIILVKP